MAEYTCGHCWRPMGDQEGGFGSYDRVPLCHPNVEGRPDCYTNVSRNGHPVLNCQPCKDNVPLEGVYEVLGAQGFSEEDVDDLLTSFEQMARGEGRVIHPEELRGGKSE